MNADIEAQDRAIEHLRHHLGALGASLKQMTLKRFEAVLNGPLKNASVRNRYDYWLSNVEKENSKVAPHIEGSYQIELFYLLRSKGYIKYNTDSIITPHRIAEILEEWEINPINLDVSINGCWTRKTTNIIMINIWREEIMRQNVGIITRE